jgi:hypothetical protein
MSEGQLAVAGPESDDLRIAGVIGILSAIVVVVALFIVEAPPKIDDSAAKVAAYFAKHDSTLRVQGYLFLLGTAGVFVLAAGIRARLRQAGTTAVWTATWFGATIAILSILIAQGAISIALTLDPRTTGPDATRLLYRAVIEMGPFLACAVGVSMAALAIGTLRHGAFPRPLGLLAAAFAVYEILEGLCITGTSGALAPQGAINLAGPLVYLIVLLWASVVLARS